MALPEPPNGWSDDEITKFFDDLRNNTYATYANLQSRFQKLVEIDSAFRKLIEGLQYSQDWFAIFFLIRAHSNYLAAASLSSSGQMPEAYSVLRSCIENGLYGLYLSKNPNSRETWLRRHDNDSTKKRVRKEFKVGTLLKLFSSIDSKEGQIANTLYERTIDYGAHPNELALMQTLHIKKDPDNIKFGVSYTEDDSNKFQFALKTTAQIGVCVLGIYRFIYKERSDLIGLTDSLEVLREGL